MQAILGSILLLSTLIVMALIDVPFQLWQHRRDLKMTQQEVRDELKETEGKPEVKVRPRQPSQPSNRPGRSYDPYRAQQLQQERIRQLNQYPGQHGWSR